MQSEPKQPQEQLEACPPSPASFYDLGETLTKRRVKRQKKGLPAYVQHQPLCEMEMNKPTPQQVTVLKQKGLLPAALSSTTTSPVAPPPATEPPAPIRAPSIIPVKKRGRRLNEAEEAAPSSLAGPASLATRTAASSGKTTPACPNRARRSQTPVVPKTYPALLALVREELPRHSCSLQILLRTLSAQAAKIADAAGEHAHRRTRPNLSQLAATFYNLTQNRHACCVRK